MSRGEKRHWLYRPGTVGTLWRWGAGVLALTVIVQLAVEIHGHFGFDSWFGFNAVYGFASCVAMVLFAKWLGKLVKRDESYYGGDEE